MGGITEPNIQAYNIATVINTLQYGQRDKTYRLIGWNKEFRNRPTQIFPTVFDKGTEGISWRKNSL